MKNGQLEKILPSVLQVKLFSNLIVHSCLAHENQLTATKVKEEKTDSRGQIVLKKLQAVCTIAEEESFKKVSFKFKIFSIVSCL